MNTYQSRLSVGASNISIPTVVGERIYMSKFFKDKGLPEKHKSYQGVVDAMLDGLDVDGPIYLMVDCQQLKAGQHHRRPGLHIDGYWHDGVSMHGGNGGGGHGSGPRPPRGHRPKPGHGMVAASNGKWGTWNSATLEEHEAILLASNISACRAFVGEWQGEIGEGGDCSSIDTSPLQEVMMAANTVYRGNVGLLHQTLPVAVPCVRAVVRLNIPGLEVASVH